MRLELSDKQWDEIYQEGLALLRDLIRIDTTNPPGRETVAAQYIAEQLKADKIDSEIIEPRSGRGNLLARLGSKGESDGPLLLNGHTDVVLAEPEHWSHPPFAAEDDGTYLYGRGTVDMKNIVAYQLMAVRLLKRHKAQLRRDVILAAVADEEEGCELGSRWLVENHPDKVRAQIALGEVGGFSMDFRGVRLYPVMTAAKGVAWLRLTARGEPGHGSFPRRDSAVIRLNHALERLGSRLLPYRLTDTMRDFVSQVAQLQGPAVGTLLKGLLLSQTADLIIDRALPEEVRPSFTAQLHNTVNATVLRAGEKINVMPTVAQAECDGRLLPGQLPADLVREVQQLIGPEIEIEVIREVPAYETPHDDPVFHKISEVNRRHDPEGHVVPFLVSGFTDSNWFSTLGARCFGYGPIRLPADEKFTKRFHGHDERIPLEGFRFGLRAFVELVWELAT
ncbi:MAG: M20/M25/M40 family metallo-hydrolase [Candidatus Alcyoniella australis]|nr:M20/M25/M40 family metallo-hydrolase [Candidatus Alcyoniella australis]